MFTVKEEVFRLNVKKKILMLESLIKHCNRLLGKVWNLVCRWLQKFGQKIRMGATTELRSKICPRPFFHQFSMILVIFVSFSMHIYVTIYHKPLQFFRYH